MSESYYVSAFPNDGKWANGYPEPGITIRQYFAIRCPFNLIFSSENAPNEITPQMLAQVAYEFADAMLDEGQKPPETPPC